MTEHNGAGGVSPSGRDPRLERLLFLSDGVYAIALTLLAVELVLPEAAANLHDRALLGSLLESWPRVLAFLTSFTVIANFWVGHNVVRRTYLISLILPGFLLVLMGLVAVGIGRLINPLLLFAIATLCFMVLGVLEWREEGEMGGARQRPDPADTTEESEGQGRKNGPADTKT
ncbi:MAG: DUF1211 domain-containing protein [Rubrobacteraceae bacterium]|nr:DUF1211 domain-containing protein [Rubrobacteraceae bacterium]